MRPLIAFTFAAAILFGGSCRPQQPTPPLGKPISREADLPPTCGGGPGAGPTTMVGNERALANLINNFRVAAATPALPESTTRVGVARWHAIDMATQGALSLVGSDGEDPFRRIVCSGGTAPVAAGNFNTSIIAIGYTTDPDAAFAALRSDIEASDFLFLDPNNATLSVGYCNGYWMIIISR